MWMGNILIALGVVGALLNRSNLVLYFMSLEVLLLGVNVIFVVAALLIGDIHGVVVYLFILPVAASEVAVGLVLLVSYYMSHLDISIGYMRLMK